MSDITLEAAERVRAYLDALRRHKGLDQEDIHGLDVGSEREAILKVSDLEALLAAMPTTVLNAYFRKHRKHLYREDDA